MRKFLPLGVGALFLCAGATTATAATEMAPLVRNIGIAIFFSGFLTVLFTRIRFPAIAAFVLAGVLAGPLGLGLVTDAKDIDVIAQLGFVLLLFMIGLEIDLNKIKRGGRSIILSGVLQFPFTVLFGFAVFKGLALIGLGGAALEGNLPALYLGAIVGCSSTLLVVKLYQQAFELDTVPGRLAIGVLVFQDLWAIIVLLLQPSLQAPELGLIVASFAGIAILAAIAFAFARTLMKVAFHWTAKVPELILISAVSWCFAVVFIGANLDTATETLFGFNLHLAVGSGMGALIAGVAIANLPYSTEIVTKVGVVKDFFITLFFVGLGMSIPQPQDWTVPILAVTIAVVAVLARQIVFFPIFYWTGVDQRNAEVSAVRLAQMSEFGLVIAFLGLQLGHISAELSSAIIFAFVLTALITTPLYHAAYAIHAKTGPILDRLGFPEPPGVKAEEAKKSYRLALLGFHRVASSLLYDIARKEPELARETLVVDFNAAIHGRIREFGAHVEYGDLSNPETLMHAGIDRAAVVVSTVPDDLLRGVNNRRLVESVRRMNPNAIIIANAVSYPDAKAIYEAGANYVFLSRLEAARGLSEAVGRALNGTLGQFRAERTDADMAPEARSEALP
ncbi:MAG: cation:proton antiporter domain-containing protein [Alphaproteobacteria bacterium]